MHQNTLRQKHNLQKRCNTHNYNWYITSIWLDQEYTRLYLYNHPSGNETCQQTHIIMEVEFPSLTVQLSEQHVKRQEVYPITLFGLFTYCETPNYSSLPVLLHPENENRLIPLGILTLLIPQEKYLASSCQLLPTISI